MLQGLSPISQFTHQVKVLSVGHLSRFSGLGSHRLNLFCPQVLPQFGTEIAAGLQHRSIEPFEHHSMMYDVLRQRINTP